MPVIIIALCLFVTLFSWTKERNLYNPLVLFFGLWGIIVFGASLHLFGLFKANDMVYIIIFIGLLSYLLGYCAVMVKRNKWNIETSTKHPIIKEYIINEKVFYTLGLISLFIIWKTALPNINLLLSGSNFYDMRYVTIESTMGSQNNLLFSYLSLPFSHIMMHLSLIYFFLYRKKTFLLLTILAIVGVVLTNGARMYLLYFLIDALVIKTIYNDKYSKKLDEKSRKISRNRNKYISILTLLLLTGMTYITLARNADILKTIYKYIVGAIPHMGQRYEQFQFINQYTYGVTSYMGFLRPLFSLLDKFGVESELFVLSDKLTDLWQAPALIAPDTIYNFCVSLFMYFYVDLGMIGVGIGSLLYGVICAITYNSMKNNTNVKSLALYLMIVQSLLVSMMRYQFTDLAFALSFIYINFVIKKRNKFDEELI